MCNAMWVLSVVMAYITLVANPKSYLLILNFFNFNFYILIKNNP